MGFMLRVMLTTERLVGVAVPRLVRLLVLGGIIAVKQVESVLMRSTGRQ